jgi:hypothetical protein
VAISDPSSSLKVDPSKYSQTVSDCGGDVEILKPRERWRLLQQWRECNAAGLFTATEQDVRDD